MVSRWTATKVFKIAIFFLKKIESSSVQGTRCLHLARLAHTVKGRYEPQELPAKHYERALRIIWKQKKSCVQNRNHVLGDVIVSNVSWLIKSKNIYIRRFTIIYLLAWEKNISVRKKEMKDWHKVGAGGSVMRILVWNSQSAVGSTHT